MIVQSKGFITPISNVNLKNRSFVQFKDQLNVPIQKSVVASSVPMMNTELKDTVRFSGDDLINKEAKDMMKTDKRKEVFIPHFYRGALPLKYLSRLEVNLSPEKQARVDAFKTLISVGLRPKNLNAKDEAQALAKLDNPTPAVKAMLEELKLDPAILREPVMDAHEIDRTNDIPAKVLQRSADLGLLRLKIPKEYGGLDFHQKEYGQILQTFADISSSLGTIISAHSTIGSAPLLEFGTKEQKDKYLNMFAQGEALAAFGLTEPLAGTDLNKLSTTAKLSEDGKHWKISGEKLFITGIMDAGMVYLVTGHTEVKDKEGKTQDLGPTVFLAELPFKVDESWEDKKAKLLELDQKGMRITPFTRDGFELMMIRGTDQGFIQLKDFEVPVENVLGPRGKDKKGNEIRPEGKGKIVPLISLNRGRAGFGPYVSEASAWFATRSLEWAADREMFDMYSKIKGKPGIQGNMEYVTAKLGRMQIKCAALKAVSDMTSALIDDNPELGVAAISAAIKTRVTDQSWEIAQDALEIHGGNGLIKESPSNIELAFRDAWIPKIVEGVNPAMAQFVHLIGGKGPMKEMKTFKGIFNTLKNQAIAFTPLAVTEKGVLPLSQAKWIQKHTAKFARSFGKTAILLGNAEMGRRQNTLIRAYNVLMDLFTLTAVQIKLQKEKESLSKEETLALKAATKVLKYNIKNNLKYVNTKGHPMENIERKVGEAFIEAELGRKDQRENVIDKHLAFMHDKANDFFNKLATEASKSSESGCSTTPKSPTEIQPV